MTRNDIMDGCPEGFETELKDIIDYFEGRFADINSLLNLNYTADIVKVLEAQEMAEKLAEDLY